MFLSEWRGFPSVLCLAGKKTWWQLVSRCCWNGARSWHAFKLVSFLVGLRTYQHRGTSRRKPEISRWPWRRPSNCLPISHQSVRLQHFITEPPILTLSLRNPPNKALHFLYTTGTCHFLRNVQRLMKVMCIEIKVGHAACIKLQPEGKQSDSYTAKSKINTT